MKLTSTETAADADGFARHDGVDQVRRHHRGLPERVGALADDENHDK